METQCQYVSSRGIMKSCDLYSSKPYSSTRYCTNLTIFSLSTNHPQIIYVCSSAIPHFYNTILPNITDKFILVSGDCDETIPNDLYNKMDVEGFLNHNMLIKWYCQNWIGSHAKVEIMPIGLNYHTMTYQNSVWGSKTSPLDQEKLLINIIKKSQHFSKRQIKCYANFHFAISTRYGSDRTNAIKNIPTSLMFYEPVKINRLHTWLVQSKYAFVISPAGDGYDCYRTWEALCLGCIPIIKKNAISKLFMELPVLIVNDWTDVNEELLINTVHKFKDKQFNMDKLTLKYWTNLIKINAEAQSI